MTLARRLQQLELKLRTKMRGCNPTLFIVVPEEMQQGPFDADSYRPANKETENYLSQLKDSGQCRDCKGSCAMDWAPSGFSNHILMGECKSSCSKTRLVYCADRETKESYVWLSSEDLAREPKSDTSKGT